jgi:hypothetical protein
LTVFGILVIFTTPAGIILNVPPNIIQVLFIANDMIPMPALPNRLTLRPSNGNDAFRGGAFETADDSPYRLRRRTEAA